MFAGKRINSNGQAEMLSKNHRQNIEKKILTTIFKSEFQKGLQTKLESFYSGPNGYLWKKKNGIHINQLQAKV